MIQRIQSLYLSLTIILSVLFLNGSILKFINNSGSEFIINFIGIYQKTGPGESNLIQRLVPLSVLIVMIPVLAFVAAMLYKNRKLQLKITLGIIVFSAILVILLAFYGVSVINDYKSVFVPGYMVAVPILIVVFAILAYRGIRKDENLVRSYDRLR